VKKWDKAEPNESIPPGLPCLANGVDWFSKTGHRDNLLILELMAVFSTFPATTITTTSISLLNSFLS
jgi:hypothetical protein